MSDRKSWGWKILLCLDQLFAVMIFDCDEDETASSYIGRNRMGCWQQKTLDWIAYQLTGRINHCKQSIESRFI